MIGIYCIFNMKNNKKYIGQSKNIEKRISGHFCSLRKNVHKNKKMQEDFNENSNYFNWKILELCDKENLNEREKYWIKKENSIENGYNFSSGRIGVIYEIGENFKKREEFLLKYNVAKQKQKENKCPSKTSKIFCITTKEVFESPKSAVEKYPSADVSTIYKCCKNINKKGSHSSGTYKDKKLFWCYFGDYLLFNNMQYNDILLYFNNISKYGKKILCINTGEKFDSILEASKKLGISSQSIVDNLKERTALSKGNLVFIYL